MTDDYSIHVAIARIEEKLDAIDHSLSSVVLDNRKCHEDHEARIREIERVQNVFVGKMLAIAAVFSAMVGYLVSWLAQAGPK